MVPVERGVHELHRVLTLDNVSCLKYHETTTPLSIRPAAYDPAMARSQGAELALLLLGGFDRWSTRSCRAGRRGHPGVRPGHEFALRAIDAGADHRFGAGRRPGSPSRRPPRRSPRWSSSATSAGGRPADARRKRIRGHAPRPRDDGDRRCPVRRCAGRGRPESARVSSRPWRRISTRSSTDGPLAPTISRAMQMLTDRADAEQAAAGTRQPPWSRAREARTRGAACSQSARAAKPGSDARMPEGTRMRVCVTNTVGGLML